MIEEALKKDENTAITLVEIKELCQNIRDNSWFDGTGRGDHRFPRKGQRFDSKVNNLYEAICLQIVRRNGNTADNG